MDSPDEVFQRICDAELIDISHRQILSDRCSTIGFCGGFEMNSALVFSVLRHIARSKASKTNPAV
ncbi:hypothetical protein [Roseibium marinum]|uniref:hypothetical protein n=1 Tax=Roseibium marinum TaxID=281252 RepID=UPI0011AF8ED5|nr:hypothetical protein [Roseibium marinum]